MAEDLTTAEPMPPSSPRFNGRAFLRRVVYPLLAIGAIAAVIWYIEYRPDGDVSPSGERYGPVDLPLALAPVGAKVAAEEGALAPNFLLESLRGDEMRLSDFRGRPVVLNFWATWCRSCRKEIPQLVEAYDQYRDEGLVVLALNLQEGRGIVRPWAEDFGMEFPILIDRDGEVGDKYRVGGLPWTYFIDSDGVVQSVFIGPFLEDRDGTSVQDAISESELQLRIAEILVPAGHEEE